mgnify:FL=1
MAQRLGQAAAAAAAATSLPARGACTDCNAGVPGRPAVRRAVARQASSSSRSVGGTALCRVEGGRSEPVRPLGLGARYAASGGLLVKDNGLVCMLCFSHLAVELVIV